MKMNNEKGAALLELAIALPLLLVILFGIIEFGILLYDRAMLTNASREGARAGIVYDFDDNNTPNDASDDSFHPTIASIETVAEQYCQDHLISFGSGSTLVVTVSRDGDDAGDLLTVNLTYPFRFLLFSNVIGLLGGNIGNTLNLEAETVMRME
jgi:Flp pilus assembly protein TadG